MNPFPYTNKNQKIFFIAELCSNHNNSLDRIKSLINTAKYVGCDAVKFQYFTGKKLYHLSQPDNIAQAQQRQIPIELLIEASNYAHDNSMAFGCSIFHPEDAEAIALLCDFLKISSYDCLRPTLINACREIDRSLFISTGMCTREEITKIGYMTDPRADDGFFHCVSHYPVSTTDIFLPRPIEQDCFSAWIGSLQQCQMGCFYHGWSDHTCSPPVIYAAIANGYNMFECHFDLSDCKGNESSYGHCWTPTVLRETISTTHTMHKHIHSCRLQLDLTRPDRSEYVNRADPSDGMRPLKEYR